MTCRHRTSLRRPPRWTRFPLLFLVPLVSFTSAAKTTTLIPNTTFSSRASFDALFAPNYPWGTDHNGAARMSPSQIQLSSDGVLTLTATRAPAGQKPASHGGKQIAIKYLSGAVAARQHFAPQKGGGFDFAAEVKAPVGRGTWPAFWLTYVDGWPPEIDMAEWKGSGKISFNTFNTSSQVQAKDVAYPQPGEWHSVKSEIRDVDGRDVSVRYYLDGKLVVTQGGKGYVGKAMYL